MSKLLRDYRKITRAVCPAARIEVFSKSHYRFAIFGPRGEATVIAARSPSDHRSLLNFRADVRRAAKKAGLV